MKYNLVVNGESGYIHDEFNRVVGLWFSKEEHARNKSKIEWTLARLDVEGMKVTDQDYIVAITGGGRIQQVEQKPYGVFLWFNK
jgi:hypothetical protein